MRIGSWHYKLMRAGNCSNQYYDPDSYIEYWKFVLFAVLIYSVVYSCVLIAAGCLIALMLLPLWFGFSTETMGACVIVNVVLMGFLLKKSKMICPENKLLQKTLYTLPLIKYELQKIKQKG